jgi:hypothetical protein
MDSDQNSVTGAEIEIKYIKIKKLKSLINQVDGRKEVK